VQRGVELSRRDRGARCAPRPLRRTGLSAGGGQPALIARAGEAEDRSRPAGGCEAQRRTRTDSTRSPDNATSREARADRRCTAVRGDVANIMCRVKRMTPAAT
jgi:hypothetical protein